MAEVLEATIGGTRRHLLYILHGLDPEQFELTFIYSAERDPEFRDEIPGLEALGVRCIEVPMVREVRPWPDLRALWRLIDIFRKGRFDAVHTHSSKAGFLGRLAAWLTGVPRIFYTPHVYYFQSCRGLKRIAYWTLEWLAGFLTTRVLAVARSQRDIAVRAGVAGPRQIVVIENGVDTVIYGAVVSTRPVRRRWGLAGKRPVVGMVARLMHQKGCDVFLRMAANIHRELPEVRFVLAGEGDLRADIEKERDELGLHQVVKLLGHCADPRPVYAICDVMTLTSRYEGMPYVLLEAMAAGCPLVVTDVAGSRDVVRDGWNGFVVKEGDAAALAERVIRLVTDREVSARMASRGRDLVAHDFSRELFLVRLEEFLLREI